MRRFVIGDIHGAHKALKQCLDRSGFDKQLDLLISLGDICDGWPETKACIDELLEIRKFVLVMGNHDKMALEWMECKSAPAGWLSQGGQKTIDSYKGSKVPDSHLELLKKSKKHYQTDDDKLFVHAGINPRLPMEGQDEETLLWDRSFYNHVKGFLNNDKGINFTGFSEVYIGHSPIHKIGLLEPKKIGEVWLMDTGAAWEGTLSLMDIDSKECFISDKPVEMYPKGGGR